MTLRSFIDGAVFADVSGASSPTVVTLHGWGRDRSDLAGATSALPVRSVAFDLPGFGSSPEPPIPWGAEQYADLIGRALDELMDHDQAPGHAQRSVVLVGHSFGGRVAVCLAAARPSLVAGLLLSGVPLLRNSNGKPAAAFRAARLLHRSGMLSDKRMEAFRRRSGSDDYRAASGTMRATLVRLVNESYEVQLAQLVCPVALVWGDEDAAAPLRIAQLAVGLLHTPYSLDLVPGVGHEVHRQRADLLRKRVSEMCGVVAP